MSYLSDAKEHMRKEDYEDIVKSRSRGDYEGYRRRPVDYYESYYPACVRPYLPKKRDGNIMILYESSSGFTLSIGPHWPGTLVVVAMLLVGSWMNFGRVKGSLWLETFVVTQLSLSLVFLFLTALSDPGIIRYSILPFRVYCIACSLLVIDRTSVAVADEETAERLVYCDICSIHRAPTTVHCFDCNCCIEEMDHHCPWMSKCIGKKK